MKRLGVPLAGAFASGMVPGLIAAALPLMAVGDAAKSSFVSSAMCGMVVASLVGGFLADRFGRIRSIRFAGLCALLGTPLMCLPESLFPMSVFGRFVQGLGLGLFSVLLPIYIAETQPDSSRGKATALYQFSNSLGGIVASLCCLAIAAWGLSPQIEGLSPFERLSPFVRGLSPSVVWRMDILLVLPILIAFFIGSFLLPLGTVPIDAPTDTGTVPTCTGTVPMRALALVVIVLALTSATGIGAVMHYSVTMMSDAGLSGAQANAADAVMRVAGLLAALLSAAFIDRRGRAFVLKIGTFGATIALFAIACIFALLGTVPVEASVGTVPACGAQAAGFAVAGLMCAFAGFFSFGPGVCVWVVAAEMLPAPVRAKGMSFALLGNQLVTMGIASVFLPAASRFGYAPLFFAFALAAAAYFALAVFLSWKKASRRRWAHSDIYAEANVSE